MVDGDLEEQFEELLLPRTDIDEQSQEPLISKKTIERTRKSIDLMIKLLQKEKGVDLGNHYSVDRGPKGSVDVLWQKNVEYGALMNVPSAEKNEPVTYYWERDDKSDRLKGELES